MKSTYLIIFTALLSLQAMAQNNSESLFEHFSKQDLLQVTLETDFTSMLSDKQNEAYQTATFSYMDENKQEVIYEIKVRQRGKYRRRVCEMPPLKLNFDKEALLEKGFLDFDKVKLVTYCLDDIGARNTVVREYLAYQLYNELTPYSYRTQLVKVTYVDTMNPKNKIKHFGFLIESTRELATRIGGEEVETFNISPSDFNPRQEALAATFQYMIGNADWSTSMMRNVKIIRPDNEGKLIPIPYDFDFSGMVSASYAIPNNDLGLKSVKERAYMGYKEDNASIGVMQSYLERKKADLYQIINRCKYLPRTNRYEVIEYLDTYYEDSKIMD
ncbi:MAG: hypothetical protein AAF849_05210 [Bacteroidota bacterium]